MTNISVDQIRQRLKIIDQRRQYYEWKSGQPERLARHEVWRHAYLANPYLIGAPDDRVDERFTDIFLNVMEVGRNGMLRPVSMPEIDNFSQIFTHILEEYESRADGKPSDGVIQSARERLFKYFEQGTPRGVTMFAGYKEPTTPILVKYGKRRFLESMLQTGNLRLANAGLYNNASLLDAIHDNETSRTLFIPTYTERLDGKSGINFQGHQIDFDDDDIVLPLVFDDYYLFSLCELIHYRMPTDFDADAAIVIRDPVVFKQRLISTFLTRYPDWTPMEGKVTYYDPYQDHAKINVPEMVKHFRYAYQKEVRVIFRPRNRISTDLEPLSLTIGSMTDYADLIST